MDNYFGRGKTPAFSLTMAQGVGLSVGICALVLAGYGLGFYSGRDRGLTLALDASQEYLAKLPLDVPTSDKEGMDAIASKVYAKLSVDALPDAAASKDDAANKKAPKQEVAAKKDVMPLVPASAPNVGAPTVSPSGAMAKTNDREPKDRLGVARNAPSGLTEAKEPASTDSATTGDGEVAVVKQGEVPKGWYVQVSAQYSEEDARALTTKLHESGFLSVIERTEVQKRTFFRVLVGPEQSRITAERLLQQLLHEKYIDKAPFVRNCK